MLLIIIGTDSIGTVIASSNIELFAEIDLYTLYKVRSYPNIKMLFYHSCYGIHTSFI